ncbi:hypothetical protein [Lentilactobacillus senioris]|uniref:hypothetical protein n=1 Tax=Lentilactobacillus senioris TaxID=931534 RepID=UPI003D27B63A
MRRHINELTNKLEEFDYNAQQALINLHIPPDEYFEQDFYRMNQVLAARPEKDRMVVDPLEFLKQVRGSG